MFNENKFHVPYRQIIMNSRERETECQKNILKTCDRVSLVIKGLNIISSVGSGVTSNFEPPQTAACESLMRENTLLMFGAVADPDM